MLWRIAVKVDSVIALRVAHGYHYAKLQLSQTEGKSQKVSKRQNGLQELLYNDSTRAHHRERRMHTFKEAIEQIRAAGGGVTYDQLRHWEGLRLLEVVEGKSRGGRPPKMLTEESLGAAISLSRWYRVVRNPEAAKILLWLEGFDFVGVDPVRIAQRLRAELYEDLKVRIPSLPPFGEIDPDSPLMDRVLREIDANFTKRGQADFGGLLPLLFGMIPNPEDFDLEHRYSSLFGNELEDPLPSALDMLMATQSEMLKETPEFRGYMNSGAAITPAMMRDGWLAMVHGNLQEVDWGFLRTLWQAINLTADVASELWESGMVDEEDRLEAKSVINLRYELYARERESPGGALFTLIPLCLAFPDEYRPQLNQLLRVLKGLPLKP